MSEIQLRARSCAPPGPLCTRSPCRPLTLAALLLTTPAPAQPSEPVPATEPAPSEPAPSEPAPAEPAASAAEPAPPAANGELSAIEAALARDAASSTPAPAVTPPSGAPQSLNPDIALIGDFALAAYSSEDNHQTGGHDPSEKGFNLQALELVLGAAVDPYLRFDTNIAFALDEVEIEEAYATTLALGGRFQARFGQFLSRFGRINASHPHAWEFADQPFELGRVFGGEGNRGLGVELSYLTPLPWYAELVASASRADGEGTARSFLGEDDRPVDGPGDFLYVAALKQFFPLSDDWSLFWGVSGAFGPNAASRDTGTQVVGTDLYIKWRPITREDPPVVSLQTEWLYRRRELVGESLHDVGGYAQLLYRFARRWSAAGRGEYGSPAHDQNGDVALDPLDPEWTRTRTRASLALTFYPTEFSRFRLQGSRDAGIGDAVWAGFLSAEVAIGAHGAHSF
ncbi:MAG: zinc-regulated TonB-dependent outer membrane receptor [Polyangiaceae bacterium]